MGRLLLLVGMLLLVGCTQPVEEIAADPARAAKIKEAAFTPDAGDWPAWRGPKGNGHAPESSPPTSWDKDTNIRWKVKLPGRGHSSPIIVGDTIYLASARDKSSDDPQQQLVLAVDRTSGDILWEKVVFEGGFPPASVMHPKSTHANGTLACDGERLITAFLNREAIHVVALALDGTELWRKEIGPFQSKFGYAPSPFLYGDTVIVAADNRGGGYLASLDRATGDIIWRKQRPAVSTYSSPTVVNLAGRDQLIISGADKVSAYDPATGEALWNVPGTAGATCGTAVADGTRVIASGGFPSRQTICVEVDEQLNAEIVWRNNVRVYEPSLLIAQGLVYCANDDGIAYCWDLQTGEQQWKKRLGDSYSASPVLCGDNIYVTDNSGKTTVFKAGTRKFERVAQNQLGKAAFATLAVSNDALFLRYVTGSDASRQEWLACIAE